MNFHGKAVLTGILMMRGFPSRESKGVELKRKEEAESALCSQSRGHGRECIR